MHEQLFSLEQLSNGDAVEKEKSVRAIMKEVTFKRILNVSSNHKRICVEFQYRNEPGILVLEKTPFKAELAEAIVGSFSETLENASRLFQNDIFGSYLIDLVFKTNVELNLELNKVFSSVIYPARPRDIEKYKSHGHLLVRETSEMYRKFTKPFIDRQRENPGHLQWIYNILELKSEVDRIVYKENLDSDFGFIMVKDMKWKIDSEELTEEMKTEMYVNALVARRDLSSLRDLNSEHLPLLENMYEKGVEAITRRYSIPREQIRVFIHYQPSFYHLHVHFTHVKGEHAGFQVERAHLLSNVIENIRLIPDYYQRMTLEFILSDQSELKFTTNVENLPNKIYST